MALKAAFRASLMIASPRLNCFSAVSGLSPNKAIAQTKEAIQRSRDLLEAIGENPPTKVLQELADSTPELIKKLEKELKSLEKALEKKTSGK